MLILCEPSVKAMETANHIHKLSKEIGIKKIYGVANKISSAEQMDLILDGLDFEVIGKIPHDEEVIKADMLGVPLTDRLPHPKALKSIKEIGKKIGKI